MSVVHTLDKNPALAVWPRVGEQWPEYNIESDQARGLAAWWSFVPNPPGEIRELTGLYTGTNAGASRVIESFGPGIFCVNATSTYIDGFSIPLAAPFSFIFWARPTSSSGFRGLAGATNAVESFYINLRTDEVFFRNPAEAESATLTYTASGAAQHYVFTLDGSANWEWFLDGRSANSGGPLSRTSFLDWSQIGRFWDDNIYTFDGTIYEIRLYNRLLTAAEVRALYDPRTRWELYQVPRRIYYSLPGAPSVIGPFPTHFGV